MSDHTGHGDPTDTPLASVRPPSPSAVVPVRATVAQATVAPLPAGRNSSLLLAHGSMQVRFYAPRGVDDQTPHT